MTTPSRQNRERSVMRWLALVLLAGCVVVAWPFASWVILAVWTAAFVRRIHVPLSRSLGQRPRSAALLAISMFAIVVTPIVVVLTALVFDAIQLVERLIASDRVQELLQQLAAREEARPQTSSDVLDLILSQAERGWAIVQQVAGAAARMVIGLVIFIAATYTFLVDGERWYSWIERNAPISASSLHRLADAFIETGRGLFVGIAGAGLAQATLATIVYVVVDVPQPFVLGLLTLVMSVVPVVGTALVWLPIAAGLALDGRFGAAVVVVIAGVLVIGTIDNLVRPYLARRGHLQLPTLILLIAMFGGVVVFGGWGLLVGPLIARLAKEVIAILRDAPDTTTSPQDMRGDRERVQTLRATNTPTD